MKSQKIPEGPRNIYANLPEQKPAGQSKDQTSLGEKKKSVKKQASGAKFPQPSKPPEGLITSRLMSVEELFGTIVPPANQKISQQKPQIFPNTKKTPVHAAQGAPKTAALKSVTNATTSLITSTRLPKNTPILTFGQSAPQPATKQAHFLSSLQTLFGRIYPPSSSLDNQYNLTNYFKEALSEIEELLNKNEATPETLTDNLKTCLDELSSFGEPARIDPKFFFLAEVKKLCTLHGRQKFYAHALTNLAKPLKGESTQLLPAIFYDKASNIQIHQYEEIIDNVANEGIKLIEKAHKNESGFSKIKKNALTIPYSLIAKKEQDGSVHLYAATSELGTGAAKRVKRLVSLGNYLVLQTKAHASPRIIKPLEAEDKARQIKKSQRQFMSEAQASKKLRAAGAQHVLELHTVEHNGKVRLFSEVCSGGDLHNFLELPRSLETRMRIAREQAHTLFIAHEKANMCILDLKSANIFMQKDPYTKSYTSKLGDLGKCKNIMKSGIDGRKNTENNRVSHASTYPPPEMNIMFETTVSPAIDMWAFGIILYQLKHNKPESSHVAHLSWQHQGSAEYKEALQYIRTTCKTTDPIDQLILRLLSDDPKKRPSAKEALAIIENYNLGGKQ